MSAFPFFISDIMEYKYDDEDFDDLLFNVYKVPKKENVADHFPELIKHPEFEVELAGLELHRDRILRYIVYKYDRNSPLLDIEDFIKRKVYAAQLAGFRPNASGQFSAHVRWFLRGSNPTVNAMIIRYCRMQYPKKWGLIVAGNEAYYNILLDLATKEKSNSAIKEAGKKQDLFMKAEVMVQKLETMTQDIFNGDESQLLDEDLYRVVEEDATKQRRMSPEQMAI